MSRVSFLDRDLFTDSKYVSFVSTVVEYSDDNRSHLASKFFHNNPLSEDCHSLVNWISMQQIYPPLTLNGGPTSIFLTSSYIIAGTKNGAVLIFNHKQLLLSTLTPKTSDFQSPAVSVCMSNNGSHVAAAYATGDIFMWDLNQHIDSSQNSMPALFHIPRYEGSSINGLDFLPGKRLSLVASYSKGQVLLHQGSRTLLWQQTYQTKSLMNVTSVQRQLLGSAIAPSLKDYPDLHLVAVLCSACLTIICINPTLATHWLQNFPASEANETGSVAWSADSHMVAYALGSSVHTITIDQFSEENIKISKDPIWSWNVEHTIASLQWLSKGIIGVLTDHSLVIVLNVKLQQNPVIWTLKLDPQCMFNGMCNTFSCLDNQFFYLTQFTVNCGKFAAWSDIFLHYMKRHDYGAALNIMGFLMTNGSSIAPLIKLGETQNERKDQLLLPFRNLALSTLKSIMRRNNIEYNTSYDRCTQIFEVGSLFGDQFFSILEEMNDFISDTNKDAFYDAISNEILEHTITTLPPVMLKGIMQHFADKKNLRAIELLIITLNQSSLDIDMSVKLCKKFKLYGVLVYLWNNMFSEYSTPFIDYLFKITKQYDKCLLFDRVKNIKSFNIYHYLTAVLTGYQYPTKTQITPAQTVLAKEQLYTFLFSGTSLEWPVDSGEKFLTCQNPLREPAYPYFQLLLKHDPESCLYMLHKIFEDTHLNDDGLLEHNQISQTQISRQFVVDILIGILKTLEDAKLQVLIAIFITRNIPKFPQFIKLSNSALDELIWIICGSNFEELNYDSQRSLESLFSIYKPNNMEEFIVYLKDRKFDYVLLPVYKSLSLAAEYLMLRIESEELKSLPKAVSEILSDCATLTVSKPIERRRVAKVIEAKINKLLGLENTETLITAIYQFDSEVCSRVLKRIRSKSKQKECMELFFGMVKPSQYIDAELKYTYLKLCCEQGYFTTLHKYLGQIDYTDLDSEKIIEMLKDHSDTEGLVIVYTKLKNFEMAILQANSGFSDSSECGGKTDAENFIDLAIEICEQSGEQAQNCWTNLITSVLSRHSKLPQGDKAHCSYLLQQVFLRLLQWESSREQGLTVDFWNILTAVLSHQNMAVTKINDIKTILAEIIKIYTVEESIHQLILRIIENSSHTIIHKYLFGLQQGWPIENYECEVCGKTIWGMGVTSKVFIAWKLLYQRIGYDEQEVLDINNLIVFHCHHGFHESCLRNMGQNDDSYYCLICDIDGTIS
ncbi:HFR002Cp [Eremothecium sinecaudum]|uniref:HFR002Cp n=1 Tax=Eremothecium sinecaudum TaxID=45286 RepID=A0A120K2K9_9SACH|nr:HFR002Cp [Eremothecium sinecaudum]AMD21857.1 HFR002Cp [Eremothecium sinecaudum]